MPTEFCTFTDRDGNLVAVNPQQVRCVRPTMPDSARIEFDDNHYVIVKASVIDVTRGLRTNQN
jgi:hypothetical protein